MLDANAGAIEILKNEKLSASDKQMQFSEIAHDINEMFDDDGRTGRVRNDEPLIKSRDRRRRGTDKLHTGSCGSTNHPLDFYDNMQNSPDDAQKAWGGLGILIGNALGWFDHPAHCRGCGNDPNRENGRTNHGSGCYCGQRRT